MSLYFLKLATMVEKSWAEMNLMIFGLSACEGRKWECDFEKTAWGCALLPASCCRGFPPGSFIFTVLGELATRVCLSEGHLGYFFTIGQGPSRGEFMIGTLLVLCSDLPPNLHTGLF